MKKLSLFTLLGLVFVLAAGAFAVQAADPMPTATPEPVIRPSFTDGRINAYDPGAPIAVFETHETVPIINDNGVPTTADVVNGVQLLFWDGASAKEVLNVSADDIKAVVDKVTPTTNLTSNSAANANNANSTINANDTSAGSANMAGTNANSVVISRENGYTLNYSKDGYLWVSTPPDYEGKVYTFSWQLNF